MIKQVIDAFFVFNFILDQYKTQKMRDRIVSGESFLIVYCSDKYKTQRMCDEVADDYLDALKFIPDWLLQVK